MLKPKLSRVPQGQLVRSEGGRKVRAGKASTEEGIGLMEGIIHGVCQGRTDHIWVLRGEISTAMLTGDFETEVLDLHLELSATRRAGLDEVCDSTHDGISFYRNC